jgi:hypothetical protein
MTSAYGPSGGDGSVRFDDGDSDSDGDNMYRDRAAGESGDNYNGTAAGKPLPCHTFTRLTALEDVAFCCKPWVSFDDYMRLLSTMPSVTRLAWKAPQDPEKVFWRTPGDAGAGESEGGDAETETEADEEEEEGMKTGVGESAGPGAGAVVAAAGPRLDGVPPPGARFLGLRELDLAVSGPWDSTDPLNLSALPAALTALTLACAPFRPVTLPNDQQNGGGLRRLEVRHFQGGAEVSDTLTGRLGTCDSLRHLSVVVDDSGEEYWAGDWEMPLGAFPCLRTLRFSLPCHTCHLYDDMVDEEGIIYELLSVATEAAAGRAAPGLREILVAPRALGRAAAVAMAAAAELLGTRTLEVTPLPNIPHRLVIGETPEYTD